MPTPQEGESREEFVDRCIPIVIRDGTAEDGSQANAICNSLWEEKSMKREPGKITIKSQDAKTAVIGGYGIVFGGEDLQGEYFDAKTDLMLDLVPTKALFYEHTQDLPQHALGKTIKEELDEVGIWIEAQIDKSKAYAEAVLELIGQGVIGLSSGTAGHLSRREGKHITRWPVVEYSLTPQPAEPRTLGVGQIKALFEAAGLQMPEAFNEAEKANAAEKPERQPKPNKEKPMDEKEKEQPKSEAPVLDTKAILTQLKAELRAEEEAKAAEEAKFQERLDAEKKKWEADQPAWKGGFNVVGAEKLGTDQGGHKAFRHWLATGDGVPYRKVYAEAAKSQIAVWQDDNAVKAALQGQTDVEGGYLVPDDFYNQIVAKRDDMSVIRRVGATVIQTTLDRVLIPTEGTSMSKFAITAEEAAVNEDEPQFSQSIAVVHKATKLVKVSEELMADEKANLQPFLSNAFGRAEAEWENYYFVSTGNGSSQPNSALNVSGAAVTAAGTNSITAAEINTFLYSLGAPYASSPSVALVSRRVTQGAVFGLSGNPFLFQATPQGAAGASRGQFDRMLDGIPYHSDETMPALATGNKVLLLGDFSYYFVAERMGLMIQRLDELYAGNGQIGLLAKFRRGGVPTQSEAFKHMVTT